jgi:hypothetical protein
MGYNAIMKSPFPGMDPYLESRWLDVHTRLIMYAADSLDEQLPPGLAVSTEERVAIESGEERLNRVGPDVGVYAPASADPEPAGKGVALAAPYKLVIDLDPITERFIKIVETAGERLITVIEMLSPTNKVGRGLKAYRRKRSRLINSGVHLVEIDLVRRGDWRRVMRPFTCPPEAATAYRAIVYSGGEKGAAYLYPIGLADSLPTLPVPLRPQDAPARLDLQALLERIYAKGRYGERLDYSQPCDPPLESKEAAWTQELLHAAGRG